ncbi:MAG: transketolase [Nitrospinae bacterium]|nr:transketolase [Nitrospinota bacterium]
MTNPCNISENKDTVTLSKDIARGLRIEIIKMIYRAGSGHPGGSLSCADIIAVLYFHEMRIDPKEPGWQDRDRFILSKGHACPAWYSALALRGYFPIEALSKLRKLNSPLQGHPDMRKLPGLDMTTGSLGNGLSIGIGMAICGKVDEKDYRVYVILGCGELDEGMIWEAAMCAHKYKLDNLTAIVDYNGLQLDGKTEDIMPLEPLGDKWKAFGWNTIEIDGHNIKDILTAIDKAKSARGCPTVIIAHTVKGKGVSFMENNPDWHGKPLTKAEYEQAMKELTLGDCPCLKGYNEYPDTKIIR